jgi:hypothetical protein
VVQAVEVEGAMPDNLQPFLLDDSSTGSSQCPPCGEQRPTMAVLSQHADISLQSVTKRLQVEHLNCEEAELAIIHGFMQQLTKQVLVNYGDLSTCKQLLSALARRAYDMQGHVHTWYWAGAIAQQEEDWLHAVLFFKRAALSSLERPHLSMQAKALTASCECILSCLACRFVPGLTHSAFAAACLRLEVGQTKWELHTQLCVDMMPALSRVASPPGSSQVLPHELVWSWRSALDAVHALLKQALVNARASADEGVELRALMSVVFLLKVEGLMRAREGLLGGYEWDSSARVKWLEGSPTLATVFARWQGLMRLRRNVVSLWRMVGVAVVIDPDSEWGQGADGAAAMAALQCRG